MAMTMAVTVRVIAVIVLFTMSVALFVIVIVMSMCPMGVRMMRAHMLSDLHGLLLYKVSPSLDLIIVVDIGFTKLCLDNCMLHFFESFFLKFTHLINGLFELLPEPSKGLMQVQLPSLLFLPGQLDLLLSHLGSELYE